MASLVLRTPPPLPPVRPEPVLISAAALTTDERKRLWTHIQKNDQPMQAFLADSQVVRLIRNCGAVVQFEPALIEAALGAAALARLLKQTATAGEIEQATPAYATQ